MSVTIYAFAGFGHFRGVLHILYHCFFRIEFLRVTAFASYPNQINDLPHIT